MTTRSGKINITAIRKSAEAFSKSMEAVLNNEPGLLPKGFSLNTAKVQYTVHKFISSPNTAAAVKKLIGNELGAIEEEYRTALFKMMIGESGRYSVTSKDFADRVKATFPRSNTTRVVHRWILNHWGGDWYAYKRYLAQRRLVKTGKKDAEGKDVYRVYAGRRDATSDPKFQDNPNNYFNVGELKSGDRAARYNKTLRSTLPAKSGKAGSGKAPAYDRSAPEVDSDFTKDFNPAKIGRRAAAQTEIHKDQIPKYAVARAVEMAEHLRNGTRPTSGTKRKSLDPRNSLPYAKTGRMADSYSRTFAFRPSDIKTVSAGKGTNTINVTLSGSFRVGSMAAEYRRIFLRTPVRYKNILVYSAGNLFSDVVDYQLFRSKKFKRGKNRNKAGTK